MKLKQSPNIWRLLKVWKKLAASGLPIARVEQQISQEKKIAQEQSLAQSSD